MLRASVFSALLLAGCAHPPPAPPAAPTVVAELLPAGIYFRHHVYRICTQDGVDCPIPTAARVQGIYASIEAARAALLTTRSLAPGYPLVVHTDELGLDDPREGIVVVLGLFASPAAAQAAAVGGEAIPLLDDDAAFARLQIHEYAPREVMVHLLPGDPVPAYPREAVQNLPERGMLPASPPVCQIPAGALFLAEPRDLLYYDFAPVRCADDTVAYVPWRQTFLSATVASQGDGGWLFQQVVGAECDAPLIETSPYTPDQGRMGAVGMMSRAGC